MNRLTVLCAGLALSAAVAGAGPHFEYSGESGPDHWGSLDPEYEMCAKGRNQSPVALGHFVEAELAELKVDYTTYGSNVVNNGHTILVNFELGSTITLDGIQFMLKQVHFHAPSEHSLDGKSYPLEGHLVHADKDGNLAVISVLFDEGKSNSFLETVWRSVPEAAGIEASLEGKKVSAAALLPASKDYYRYNGSLTTPPCSEGVRWIIMKSIVQAEKGQFGAFTKFIGFANNRPEQPLNARVVLK
jgi:carbonic anhydrase